MAVTYKILGQSSPSPYTETQLYSVPSGTSAVVSTITVTNRASYTNQFHIIIRPSADATTANKHYIVYNGTLNNYETVSYTLGITLAAGDKIRVYAAGAGGDDVSFSAFGSEIS